MNASMPPEVDTSRPAASRMYDYYLGGSHHFRSDREAADLVLSSAPWTRRMAIANRAFLRRSVTYLVRDAGVRQFLDLGCGIPSAGSVHEIAQSLAADARVAYVDVDPVAVAHARLILAGSSHATVALEDIRQPAMVLHHPAVRSLLDFTAPVAVLLVSVLPFIADDESPADVVAGYLNALASGSFLAVSHASADGMSNERCHQVAKAAQAYMAVGQPVTLRSGDEIASWFDSLSLIDPGVVPLPDWRPDSTDTGACTILSYGAVGRVW